MAKRGTMRHPKNKRLARKLNSQIGVTLGLLQSLWDWVAEWRHNGGLTKEDFEDAMMDSGFDQIFDTNVILDAMTSDDSRWIDRLPSGGLCIHDWQDHCEDSVHARLYREVKPFANGFLPKPKKIGQNEKNQLEELWRNSAAIRQPPAAYLSLNHNLDHIPKPEPCAVPTPAADLTQNFSDENPFKHPKERQDALHGFSDSIQASAKEIADAYLWKAGYGGNIGMPWVPRLLFEICSVLESEEDLESSKKKLLNAIDKPPKGQNRNARFLTIAENAGFNTKGILKRNDPPWKSARHTANDSIVNIPGVTDE